MSADGRILPEMNDHLRLTLKHHRRFGTWCHVEAPDAKELGEALKKAGVPFTIDPPFAGEVAALYKRTFVFGEFPPYRLGDLLINNDWDVEIDPELISTELTYGPPVDQLLTLGNTPGAPERLDHLPRGITLRDVPELIRMASDAELWMAVCGGMAIWGPSHAVAVIGMLRAHDAVPSLLDLLRFIREKDQPIWGEDIAAAIGQIGPQALPHLAAYLADPARDPEEAEAACKAAGSIAEHYPDSRSQCVAVLAHQLKQFARNKPALNGWLISVLLDLRAREAKELINKAYAAGFVDSLIVNREELMELDDEHDS